MYVENIYQMAGADSLVQMLLGVLNNIAHATRTQWDIPRPPFWCHWLGWVSSKPAPHPLKKSVTPAHFCMCYGKGQPPIPPFVFSAGLQPSSLAEERKRFTKQEKKSGGRERSSCPVPFLNWNLALHHPRMETRVASRWKLPHSHSVISPSNLIKQALKKIQLNGKLHC